MAYAVGQVSGAHFNPAVTLGLWAGGSAASKDLVPYVVAQLVDSLKSNMISGVPDLGGCHSRFSFNDTVSSLVVG
jgi:hypothetical protein